MKTLNILMWLYAGVLYAETPLPSLRVAYLKVMQEPTGKNFQIFQKVCKQSGEKLKFEGDAELTNTLKPKKRFLGMQVHVLVITLNECTENQDPALHSTFSQEILIKNLKKFIMLACREKLPEETLRLLAASTTNRDKLQKRLKAITIPNNCLAYKTQIESIFAQ